MGNNKMGNNKMVINVSGGVLTDIYTDYPDMQVLLVDWDNEENDGDIVHEYPTYNLSNIPDEMLDVIKRSFNHTHTVELPQFDEKSLSLVSQFTGYKYGNGTNIIGLVESSGMTYEEFCDLIRYHQLADILDKKDLETLEEYYG